MTNALAKPIDSITIELSELLNSKRSYPAMQKRKELSRILGIRGVYIVKDRRDNVIYIGSTNYGPRTRIHWHICNASNLGSHIKNNISSFLIEWLRCDNKKNSLHLEHELIEQYKPILNEKN